jgi:hypothetical protein
LAVVANEVVELFDAAAEDKHTHLDAVVDPRVLESKFELVVNLTTAKALGLTIPESFLLRADEVIE